MQPGFSRACAPREPALPISWVCEANPKSKIATEGDFGKAKNGKDAVFRPRKGLEGFSHAVGGTGARKRVALATCGCLESPVFCGAKNAPKMTKKSKCRCSVSILPGVVTFPYALVLLFK
jgi:hypothetical protein